MFQGHCYVKGKEQKKGRGKKVIASFKNRLESEVFHVHNLERSKQMTDWARPDAADQNRYGIFFIPAGTKYYEGTENDLGVFTLEYVGPLTEESKGLILNQ